MCKRNYTTNIITTNYFTEEYKDLKRIKNNLIIRGQICGCLINFLYSKNITLNFKKLPNFLFDKLRYKNSCKCTQQLQKNPTNFMSFCLCEEKNFYIFKFDFLSDVNEYKFYNSGTFLNQISEYSPGFYQNLNLINIFYKRGNSLKSGFYYCPCMSDKKTREIQKNIEDKTKNNVSTSKHSVDKHIESLLAGDIKSRKNPEKEDIKKDNSEKDKSCSCSEESSFTSKENSNSSSTLKASSSSSNNSDSDSDSVETTGSQESTKSDKSTESVKSDKSTKSQKSQKMAIAAASKDENEISKQEQKPEVMKSEEKENIDPQTEKSSEQQKFEEHTSVYMHNTMSNQKSTQKSTDKSKSHLPAGYVNRRNSGNDKLDSVIGISHQSNLSITEEVKDEHIQIDILFDPVFPDEWDILKVSKNSYINKLREANLVLAEGWIYKKRYFFSCLYHKRYFVLTKDAELIYFRDPHIKTGLSDDTSEAPEKRPNTIPFNYNKIFDSSIPTLPDEIEDVTRSIPAKNNLWCLNNPKFLMINDGMEVFRQTVIDDPHPYKLVLKHSYYNDHLIFDDQDKRDLWAARIGWAKKKYSDARRRNVMRSERTDN